MVDLELEDKLTDIKTAAEAFRDEVMNTLVDSSREMSLALTKIDEAEMWAQKALNK